MYRAVTRQIEVTVEPSFLPERSSLEKRQFFWSYTVVITNSGAETVQLKTRRLGLFRRSRQGELGWTSRADPKSSGAGRDLLLGGHSTLKGRGSAFFLPSNRMNVHS